MSKPLVEQSRVTVRGYTFITQIYERRKIIFLDPQRGNKEVASVPMPEDARRWSPARDRFQRRVARMVLDNYEAQYLRAATGLELLPDSTITPQEMKKKAGYVGGRLAQSLDKEFRGAVAQNIKSWEGKEE